MKNLTTKGRVVVEGHYHLSGAWNTHLSTHLSTHLPTHPSTHLSTNLSTQLSTQSHASSSRRRRAVVGHPIGHPLGHPPPPSALAKRFFGLNWSSDMSSGLLHATGCVAGRCYPIPHRLHRRAALSDPHQLHRRSFLLASSCTAGRHHHNQLHRRSALPSAPAGSTAAGLISCVHAHFAGLLCMRRFPRGISMGHSCTA